MTQTSTSTSDGSMCGQKQPETGTFAPKRWKIGYAGACCVACCSACAISNSLLCGCYTVKVVCDAVSGASDSFHAGVFRQCV
jgi:hypothetical protein